MKILAGLFGRHVKNKMLREFGVENLKNKNAIGNLNGRMIL